jgi:hypothetical protein
MKPANGVSGRHSRLRILAPRGTAARAKSGYRFAPAQLLGNWIVFAMLLVVNCLQILRIRREGPRGGVRRKLPPLQGHDLVPGERRFLTHWPLLSDPRGSRLGLRVRLRTKPTSAIMRLPGLADSLAFTSVYFWGSDVLFQSRELQQLTTMVVSLFRGHPDAPHRSRCCNSFDSGCPNRVPGILGLLQKSERH